MRAASPIPSPDEAGESRLQLFGVVAARSPCEEATVDWLPPATIGPWILEANYFSINRLMIRNGDNYPDIGAIAKDQGGILQKNQKEEVPAPTTGKGGGSATASSIGNGAKPRQRARKVCAAISGR
jgi:hypothetical protein